MRKPPRGRDCIKILSGVIPPPVVVVSVVTARALIMKDTAPILDDQWIAWIARPTLHRALNVLKNFCQVVVGELSKVHIWFLVTIAALHDALFITLYLTVVRDVLSLKFSTVRRSALKPIGICVHEHVDELISNRIVAPVGSWNATFPPQSASFVRIIIHRVVTLSVSHTKRVTLFMVEDAFKIRCTSAVVSTAETASAGLKHTIFISVYE